jgi:hypothetical protein
MFHEALKVMDNLRDEVRDTVRGDFGQTGVGDNLSIVP